VDLSVACREQWGELITQVRKSAQLRLAPYLLCGVSVRGLLGTVGWGLRSPDQTFWSGRMDHEASGHEPDEQPWKHRSVIEKILKA
jgi:hypothetical protein